MRLPEGRLRPRPAVTAHRLRVASTLNRADRVDRADQVVLAPVDPAARAGLKNTQADPVDPVDLKNTQAVPVVQADPVDPANTAQADRVAPAALDLAGLVGLVDPANTAQADPAAQVVPAVLGTATTNAATSMAPRGATGLAPGGTVRLLVRPGIDRCRRQEARGITARSTTTATRRRPSGIPALTSLASTSSECGSRCNKPPTTPASPLGEAGVVGLGRVLAWRGDHDVGADECAKSRPVTAEPASHCRTSGTWWSPETQPAVGHWPNGTPTPRRASS
jgi:hypothetical protein